MMKKTLCALLLGLASTLLPAADVLEIKMTPPGKGPYTGKQTLNFTLKLDQAADSAKLLYFTPRNTFQIEGKTELKLTPSADKRSFTGKLSPIKYFFNWGIYAHWNLGPEKFQFIPVVTRKGKEERLKATKLPWRVRLQQDLMLAKGTVEGGGKFDTALHFDGKDSLAGVRRIKLDPRKGSIDMWLFMPLMLQKTQGIIFYIQNDAGGSWSYHQLAIPAKSRLLEYVTYRSQERKTYRIKSKTIDIEDFIFVQCTWDASANKMELFVNGKSVGSAPYKPAAGTNSSLSLGGRHHFSSKGPVVICRNQMALDEFRITSNPAKLAVPSAPHKKAPGTTVLLHFDSKELTKESSR